MIAWRPLIRPSAHLSVDLSAAESKSRSRGSKGKQTEAYQAQLQCMPEQTMAASQILSVS